jgi:ATP-binding cassette subfamily A (ABC1) protein 3
MLQEKETKVRESMSIMGMKIRNYYFSWFVRYYAVYVVLHLICAAIISGSLKQVPFYIPFVVFILFDLVLIIQNFFIQVFLTRAKIGVVIALLFFVIQYVLSFISTNSNNPTIGVNSAMSVIPHAAFVLAFQTIIYA